MYQHRQIIEKMRLKWEWWSLETQQVDTLGYDRHESFSSLDMDNSITCAQLNIFQFKILSTSI